MSQGIAVTNVSNISILGLVWSGKMLAVGLRFRMWFTALRKYSHYVKASTDLSSLGISFSRTIRLRTSAKENFIVGTKSAKGQNKVRFLNRADFIHFQEFSPYLAKFVCIFQNRVARVKGEFVVSSAESLEDGTSNGINEYRSNMPLHGLVASLH